MWFSSPAELGSRLPSARHFQCTAEHLHARQDGGRDTRTNIVAACWYCITRRHRRKRPLAPHAYRRHVRARVAIGKWHSEAKTKPTAGPSTRAP
ncbi:HNH endonuclease [Luteibacter sp. dw_328]|uniref:HNH endonuclease n=1 Tax=Luteibacter sp. dw_328 TaxID=2719796 RepID=UPI001BD1CE64|nr:HNH endonuclease [Luteibacter sp. dw_328]